MKKYYLVAFLAFTIHLITSISLFGETVETLYSVGSHTWSVPHGCSSFWVELWGGGAGGNHDYGGSGGNYTKSTTYYVDAYHAANGYNYTVGAAGAFGADGGDTYFNNYNCSAYGGTCCGKSRWIPATGGENALSYSGGRGGKGYSEGFCTFHYGGGGGSAYTTAEGGWGVKEVAPAAVAVEEQEQVATHTRPVMYPAAAAAPTPAPQGPGVK